MKVTIKVSNDKNSCVDIYTAEILEVELSLFNALLNTVCKHFKNREELND